MENVREFLDNAFTNIREFFRSPSSSRTLVLIGLIILAVALPVTVVVLQQQTNIFQHASGNQCTNLSGVCIPLGICRGEGLTCNAGLGCPSGQLCYGQVGAECGTNSDCGQGLYCSRKGTCTRPCTQSYGKACSPGSDYYCDATYNANGECAATDYKNCQHVDGQCGYVQNPTCSDGKENGTCYTNNVCGGNMHEISPISGHTCGVHDGLNFRICCAPGAPTPSYDCVKNNDYAGQIQKHTSSGTSTVTSCDAGYYCKDPSVNLVFISDGPNALTQAKQQLCVPFNPLSCNCKVSDDQSSNPNTSFTCNGGDIQRGCGPGLICSNSHKGVQGGLWPCTYCPDFTGDNQQFPNGCSDGAALYAPKCPSVDLYVAENIGYGAFTCHWTGQSSSSPAACQAVGGYCGKFGDACKAGYDESYGSLSCGTGTVCCVPQPSCSDAHGYCSSYSSNNGECTAEHVQNSTFPGCGSSGICCIPLAPEGPTDCGSLNGKCIAAGNSCPSNYEINNLGEKSCGSGNVCCIPKGTGGTTGTPKPTCDPSTQNCNTGGSTPTPACTKGQQTKIALSVKLDGIGTTTFENNDPAHPNRTGKVRVFDTSNPNGSVHGSSEALNHGKGNGKFDSATVDLGTALTCGATYKVELKLPGYLPATADVKYGDTTQVANLEPLPGDINLVDDNGVIVGDGKIGVEDYSIYRQCRNVDPNTPIPFSSGSNTVNVKCGDLINFFDFPDGGTMESSIFAPSGIGEWDANYNLWLKSYIKANGY